MRPRCGIFVCDQEATTTMRVLIPSEHSRTLRPYDMPVCPEHEISTRPEREPLRLATDPPNEEEAHG